MSIVALLEALERLGVQPEPEELRDALWLACAWSEPRAQLSSESVDAEPRPPAPKPPEEKGPSTQSTKEPQRRPPPIDDAEKKQWADLRQRGPSEARGEGGGLPFRAPAATALPEARAIACGLRPLRQKRTSYGAQELDEERSIGKSIEEERFVPVLRTPTRRWLEVALVVDGASSMVVWSRTLMELAKLLERAGAFRSVGVWTLETTSSCEWLPVRRGAFGRAQGDRLDPRILADPAGQRLILFATDGSVTAWRDGRVARLLHFWGCSTPVALVSVLPQHLLRGTALRAAPAVLVRADSRGDHNTQLAWERAGRRSSERPDGAPFPIVYLDGDSAESLSDLLLAKIGNEIDGIFLSPPALVQQRSGEGGARASSVVGAEARVQRFESFASPLAKRLARLFTNVPLSVPVMHLIRDTMVPEATLSHMAEVFLGGILREIDGSEKLGADDIRFDFHDGVRGLLAQSVSRSETMAVLQQVSRYVETHLGETIDFPALLSEPNTPVKGLGSPAVRAFARIAADRLRAFGGEYARLADRLSGGGEVGVSEEAEAVAQPPNEERRWVAVIGDAELSDFNLELAKALGKAIADGGFGLLGAGEPGVARVVAEAFIEHLDLRVRDFSERSERFIEYRPPPNAVPGAVAARNLGFHGTEWLQHYLRKVDGVLLLGGSETAYGVAVAARNRGKTVLPIPRTGGAAERIYMEMVGTGGSAADPLRSALRLLEDAMRWGFDAGDVGHWCVQALQEKLDEGRAKQVAMYAFALPLIVPVTERPRRFPDDVSNFLVELTQILDQGDGWRLKPTGTPLNDLGPVLPALGYRLLHDFVRLSEFVPHWPEASDIMRSLMPLLGRCVEEGRKVFASVLHRIDMDIDPVAPIFVEAVEAMLGGEEADRWLLATVGATRQVLAELRAMATLIAMANAALAPEDEPSERDPLGSLREMVPNCSRDALTLYLRDPIAAHRLLGYLVCEVHPNAEALDDLVKCITLERNVAAEWKEIRPLRQLLVSIDRICERRKIEPQAQRRLYVALRDLMSFLRSAREIDPRGECAERALAINSRYLEAAGAIVDRLDQFARDYEQLRKQMGPGATRTERMDELIQLVQALSKSSRFTSSEAAACFNRGGDGDRVVGLALVMGSPHADSHEMVCGAILEPRKPFEQWTALRAAEALVPRLPWGRLVFLDALLATMQENQKLVKGTDTTRLSISKVVRTKIKKVLTAARLATPVIDGTWPKVNNALWAELEDARSRLSAAARSTLRVVRDGLWSATAFVVGEELVCTAGHVAVASSRMEFRADGVDAPSFKALDIVKHPVLDVALCRVRGLAKAGLRPLRFAGAPVEMGNPVAEISYISIAIRNPSNKVSSSAVFSGYSDGSLWLLPGKVVSPERAGESRFAILGYDALTFFGSSGAPVVDLHTGHVLGVAYSQGDGFNTAVPAWEIVRDRRFRELGISVAEGAPPPDDPWSAAWEAEKKK